MNKIFIGVMLLIFILSCSDNVCAYSTSEFSISIPSGYEEVGKNSFTNAKGENINVQITDFKGTSSGNPYTQEAMNTIVNGLYTEIDTYREKLKAELRKKNNLYGANLTESQIEEYAKSFKCNSIEKKEITTFTKNNYKGFHFIVSYTMGENSYYVDQYMVASGNHIYTLSISSSTLSDINTSSKMNVVNSFTISNFQEIKSGFSKAGEKALTRGLIAFIIGGIGASFGWFNKKGKQQNEKNNNIEEKNKD